jgi:hypothetical protein
LDTYRRNPVFQNAHQYGDIIFTLGKALVTEVREVGPVSPSGPPRQALFQRIQFATDVNPIAKIAHGLYRTGCLNTVSVGFIPLRWKDTPEPDSLGAPALRSLGEGGSPDSPLPSDGRGAGGEGPVAHRQVADRQVRRYLEQELLEVSAVPIPANPNALALALKSGAIDKSDLRETIQVLRHAFTAATPQPPEPAALRLALTIRDLLKRL